MTGASHLMARRDSERTSTCVQAGVWLAARRMPTATVFMTAIMHDDPGY